MVVHVLHIFKRSVVDVNIFLFFFFYTKTKFGFDIISILFCYSVPGSAQFRSDWDEVEPEQT